VFDPLAVMLVIAYNQALLQNKPKKTQHENWKDIYSQDTLIEEDNERMDIIGQNGNDGLHYDLEDDEKKEKNPPGRGFYRP
jgi:hypothetical protein